MVFTHSKLGLHVGAALFAIVTLGAAAPFETASIAPLSPSAYNDESQPVPVAHIISAHAASYQSAPVPDEDVDGPADTTKPAPSVSPKMLSQKSLFQGDGYYYASSEQSTLDNRRAGVPGLGLSVPVK